MKNVSPFSTGLKYGIILALISILTTVILYVTGILTNEMATTILGLLSLVAYIAVIAFAIKSHRDDKQGGFITLGKALGVGVITALVSAFISGIFTYILYAFIDPGLLEEILSMTEDSMLESGLPDDQIDMAMEWTRKFTTPASQFGSGLVGGICCGSVVSLIAGLILKNEPLNNNSI